MSEKELKMFDVDAQLDAVFGKEGTPERKAAEDRANAFFTGQIIEEARKIFLASSIICPVKKALALSSAALRSGVPSLPNTASNCASTSNIFSSFSLIIFFL